MLLATQSLAQAEVILGIGLTVLFIVLAALLIQVILFVAGVISVLGNEHYSAIGKLLWVVVMFFFPIIGPILWFIIGRNVEEGI